MTTEPVAADRSNAAVLLLLIHWLFAPIFVGTLILVLIMFFSTLFRSSFSVTLIGKRELVAII